MSEINLSKQGPIATLTLNNPDQLNAMSMSMGRELKDQVQSLKKDKAIRVVILRGAGRGFSAGGHMNMLTDLIGADDNKIKTTLQEFYRTYLSIRELPQPVIAALHGPAIGAAFCLSLACDLRYAQTSTKMGANFAKIGLAPGMAAHHVITQAVGPARAKEVLFRAKTYSATEALEKGLIHDVFEDQTFDAEVEKIALELAGHAPAALQAIKQGFSKLAHDEIESVFEFDAEAQAKTFQTDDIKEGLDAVMAKRKPNFKGS